MYHEMLSIKYHVAPIQNSYKTIKDKLNLLSLTVYQFLLKFQDVKLLIKSYVLYICIVLLWLIANEFWIKQSKLPHHKKAVPLFIWNLPNHKHKKKKMWNRLLLLELKTNKYYSLLREINLCCIVESLLNFISNFYEFAYEDFHSVITARGES